MRSLTNEGRIVSFIKDSVSITSYYYTKSYDLRTNKYSKKFYMAKLKFKNKEWNFTLVLKMLILQRKLQASDAHGYADGTTIVVRNENNSFTSHQKCVW